jgi:Dolichyl-phosphate-mannose-protein mannosyltransferase
MRPPVRGCAAMTRRKPARTDSSRDTARGISLALALVLLVPRIVRTHYPEVWVEDDFYLESAWLVSQGIRPYLDFVHPHLPLLEWVAGAYLRIFGASHLTIEILNEAAIYATSLLTFSLARRVANRPTAVAAAILYAFSSIVFRYHVYERECFVAPLVIWAALVALDDEIAPLRQGVILAAIFFVACAIKLTAVIPFAIVLLFIVIARRRIVEAIASGVLFTAALGLFTALLYWRYGFAFIYQVYIFHFLKGRDTSANVALYPAMILDLLVPLFLLGCARIIAERQIPRALALVLGLVAAAYLFFGVLSPTAWGHNYLEAMPLIAIVAGLGAMRLVAAARDLITAEAPRRAQFIWLGGGALLIIICLAWLTPLVNENWLHGSIYGFGFVPRDEIERLGAAVRAASRADENVIAPSFVCFEANRRELIRFPETYGVYREGIAALRREGFLAARRQLGRADFFQLIESTAHYWTDQIKAAIDSGQVNVVVSDSPIQLLPLISVPEDLLVKNGFRPIATTEHYVVWKRSAASPSSG